MMMGKPSISISHLAEACISGDWALRRKIMLEVLMEPTALGFDPTPYTPGLMNSILRDV